MALDQLPCFPSYSPEGSHPSAWKGFSRKFGGQIAKAFSLHSMLEWLAVERVRPALGKRVGKEITKMSLSPFGRRGGFYDAHSEVNRLLDEMFGGLGRRPGSRGAQTTVEWAPSVDVLQKDGGPGG